VYGITGVSSCHACETAGCGGVKDNMSNQLACSA
jgi:hypothetical protein